MTDKNPAAEALESLESLALRSESPESIAPLIAELAPLVNKGLDDPGIPIVLVLKTDIDGNSDIRYLGEPEWAINTLRAVADQIEQEVIVG